MKSMGGKFKTVFVDIESYDFENLNLPVIFKNNNSKEYQLKNLSFGGRLCDFSKNGLSFVVYNEICSEFNIGDKVQFSTINGYSLKEPILGTLVYQQKIDDPSIIPSTKLAIRFDIAIPIKQILKYIDNQIYNFSLNSAASVSIFSIKSTSV